MADPHFELPKIKQPEQEGFHRNHIRIDKRPDYRRGRRHRDNDRNDGRRGGYNQSRGGNSNDRYDDRGRDRKRWDGQERERSPRRYIPHERNPRAPGYSESRSRSRSPIREEVKVEERHSKHGNFTRVKSYSKRDSYSRRDSDSTHSNHHEEQDGPSVHKNAASAAAGRAPGNESEDEEEEDLKPLTLNISCPAASTLVKQIEQRKQLFSRKDKPVEASASSSSVWQQTKFNDDSDGKVTAKFKRLMGIKEEESEGQQHIKQKPQSSRPVARTQSNEYFVNLEKQYEQARTITHTQRGVGLGFGGGVGLGSQKPNTHHRF